LKQLVFQIFISLFINDKRLFYPFAGSILHDGGANEKFSARLMGVFHVFARKRYAHGSNARLEFVTN